MKSRLFAVVMVFCLLAGSSAWAYYKDYDLQRANRMKDRGDFYEARRLYRAIADDWGTSNYLRREASYYMGYCSVRLHESWNAIDDYRNFLRSWDNGETRYIPDALYVLGRTYEEVRYIREAKECYRDCIRRFRYGEFPDKSRDRLRYLGEDGYYGNYNYSMNIAEGAVSEPTTAKAAKTGNDPFEGFTMKSTQTDKIASVLEAAKKGNLDEALQTLTPEEKELSVVRDLIKQTQDQNRFEQLHEKP